MSVPTRRPVSIRCLTVRYSPFLSVLTSFHTKCAPVSSAPTATIGTASGCSRPFSPAAFFSPPSTTSVTLIPGRITNFSWAGMENVAVKVCVRSSALDVNSSNATSNVCFGSESNTTYRRRPFSSSTKLRAMTIVSGIDTSIFTLSVLWRVRIFCPTATMSSDSG